MFRSLRMGSAFGIPLYLHPTFFLLPLYILAISWSEGWERLVLGQLVLFTVFACVLLHELGHALMARWFGIITRDITLYPIGGVARLESTGEKPGEEIAIAVAGPAVNLVIVTLLLPFVAMILLGHAGGDEPLSFFATYLLSVTAGNGILLLFNLIPAFPMDGGRVLRAILSLGMPRLKATEIAAVLGLIAAVGLGILGAFTGNFSLILVAVFVALAGQTELRQLRQCEAQRQEAEQAVYLPIEIAPRQRPLYVPVEIDAQPRGDTGLVWDAQRGMWVRWVDGAPRDQ